MIVVTATVWPHGQPPDSEYGRRVAEHDGTLELVRLIIVNDGTGTTHGPAEGGVGNYDVYDGDPLVASSPVDYPAMYWHHLGRIEGIDRSPTHRAELVLKALEIAAAS